MEYLAPIIIIEFTIVLGVFIIVLNLNKKQL